MTSSTSVIRSVNRVASSKTTHKEALSKRGIKTLHSCKETIRVIAVNLVNDVFLVIIYIAL